MPHAEYFSKSDTWRDGIDSTALCALEMAFETNAEFSAASNSRRFRMLDFMVGLAIGRDSVGELSPYITDPRLSALTQLSLPE